MSSNKTFSPKDFGKGLPPELFEGFSRTVLGEDEGLAEKPDEVKKELDLVRKELKILVTKEELKSLAVKIRKLETGGDKEQLLKAQNQFNKLAATLGELDKSDKGGIILSEP